MLEPAAPAGAVTGAAARQRRGSGIGLACKGGECRLQRLVSGVFAWVVVLMAPGLAASTFLQRLLVFVRVQPRQTIGS